MNRISSLMLLLGALLLFGSISQADSSNDQPVKGTTLIPRQSLYNYAMEYFDPEDYDIPHLKIDFDILWTQTIQDSAANIQAGTNTTERILQLCASTDCLDAFPDFRKNYFDLGNTTSTADMQEGKRLGFGGHFKASTYTNNADIAYIFRHPNPNASTSPVEV